MWVFGKGGFRMSTQEEWPTISGQSQTRFGENISDINHHVTMLLGIVSKQQLDLRDIKASIGSIDGRLSSLENRFGILESRFGSQESRLNSLEARLGSFEKSVNSRFETIENRFDAQDNKLDQVLLLLNTLIAKSE